MGSFNESHDTLKEVFHELEFDSHIFGDYTRKDFITAANLYLDDLIKEGMELPDE